MRPTQTKNRIAQRGSVLFNAIIYSGILSTSCFALLSLSNYRMTAGHNRWDYNEAFYHAENVLNGGLQDIADKSSVSPGKYSQSQGNLPVSYLNQLCSSPGSKFQDAWLTVQNHTGGVHNTFMVTSSAKVGNRVRTLQVEVQKDAPSKIFDYEYFLNNWGWWWGSTITGQGDNRANWDFDLRYNPTVNGSIIATGDIESLGTPINPLAGSVPIRGLAGSNPIAYLHAGSPRLQMPNLKDFSYYQSKAISKQGQLYVGSSLVVDAVHTNTSQPGLFLSGTAASPIRVNGPVVIPGDVVIKGPISGIGTLYIGGNLYIAGDVTYVNGPDFSTPPELMSAANRDTWVQNAVSAKKDLVCYAVREAVFAGQVNSSDWVNNCYNPSAYGLKNVGDESELGADGIAHTPDDGVNYLDLDNDGTPDTAWYDADGDGVVDANYNYYRDIKLDKKRAKTILNYPKDDEDDEDELVDFNSESTPYFNRIDGVIYSNHAVAMRSTKSGLVFTGAVVSRDEAIIYSSKCMFLYDSRLHSRYSNNPNRFIDLGLPIAEKIKILSYAELTPVAGFAGSIP